MAKPFVHYEAAFEDFVRARGWPYLPVDQHRRAVFGGLRVKSFDFLVYPPGGVSWLVDVKGRKFPYEVGHAKRYWENWVTHDDLLGLRQWEAAFGSGFEPVLVFAYWLTDGTRPGIDSSLHLFGSSCYAFFRIPASAYAAHARRRSPKWDTFSMPLKVFRTLAKPLESE